MTSAKFLAGGDYLDELTKAIKNAKHQISLASYMATPTKDKNQSLFFALLDAVQRAPARGVICRALFATWDESNQLKNLNKTCAGYLADNGWQVRHANPSKLLHAKLVVIDHGTVLLGSHNITSTAMLQNIEASCLIESIPFTDEAQKLFNQAWALVK